MILAMIDTAPMPPERTPAAIIRLGCDIGGTFTDIVLQLGDGRLFVNKVSTTPRDPGKAVLDGIRTVLAQSGVPAAAISEIVHGTTIASNAILQKAGAKTGVLTTRGFRDVLEIGRIRTPRMFDLAWRKPEPLAPRRWRLEASEPAAAISEIVHGTTIASNAILQKAGAKTGVLTTRGFRDVLEIGRIRTPRMFDLAWRKPEPLAPRRWRLEVS